MFTVFTEHKSSDQREAVELIEVTSCDLLVYVFQTYSIGSQLLQQRTTFMRESNHFSVFFH